MGMIYNKILIINENLIIIDHKYKRKIYINI